MPFKNRVLNLLSDGVIDRLQLRPVMLPLGLCVSMETVDSLLFIESGIASITAEFDKKNEVEIAVVGPESVLGAAHLLGNPQILNQIRIRHAGHGYTAPFAVVIREMQQDATLHHEILRAVAAGFVQSAWIVGCNTYHAIEARLARCLLSYSERMDDSVLLLNHKQLAGVLGASRATVTAAAGNLQRLRVIDYSRGRIKVTDRKRLERFSCPCYAAIQMDLKRFAVLPAGDKATLAQ